MGAFIAVVMLGLLSWAVVAMCFKAGRIVVKDAFGSLHDKIEPDRPVRPHRTSKRPHPHAGRRSADIVAERKAKRSSENHITALIHVLEMRGFYETTTDTVTYVDDTVLAKMLTTLDSEYTDGLMWVLPEYDLYVVNWDKPNDATYPYGVRTPSGAIIGYTPEK